MSRLPLSIVALVGSALASTALAQTAAPAPAGVQDAAPAAPAAPAAAATPKVGQLLRDASGRRLAPIDSIQGGNALLILDMRMYRVPLNTISQSDKGLQTSLKRADLR